MEDSFSPDRRFFPRLNSKLNLKYRIVKSPQKISGGMNSLEQFSVFENISAGGILFLASQHMPLRTILELTLELLDTDKSIDCLAKVVRIKEIEKNKTYEVGACFLDLSSRDRTRLTKYVKGEW